MRIGDLFFNPYTVNIFAGQTVCWWNQGQVAHTVTSDTGLFNSRNVESGSDLLVTFTTEAATSTAATSTSRE